MKDANDLIENCTDQNKDWMIGGMDKLVCPCLAELSNQRIKGKII